MSSKLVTIRTTPIEGAALRKAAVALGIGNISSLVETAAMEAAHWLGFYDGFDPPIKRRPEWKDEPDRQGESTKERFAITLGPQNHAVMVRAADYARTSLPLFMIGSALRYIARKQRQDRKNKTLASIVIPRQYTTE